MDVATLRLGDVAPEFSAKVDEDDRLYGDERDELGALLEVVCARARCGLSLGRYRVHRLGGEIRIDGEDSWFDGPILLISTDRRLGSRRKGRIRWVEDDPTITSATRYDLHYSWECSCGASGYRRADRLSRLPVTPNANGGWTLAL